MDVMYAFIKAYITECNDVIKRHSNVVTIWHMSAIKVTALLKNLHSEMKGVQEKRTYHGCEGRQKNTSFAITVWHREAC